MTGQTETFAQFLGDGGDLEVGAVVGTRAIGHVRVRIPPARCGSVAPCGRASGGES